MADELELQDSPNPADENEDSPNLEQNDDAEKVAKLAEENKRLFARAKKAEEEAKTLKSKKEETPISSTVDVEEIINTKLEERDLASLEFSDELKGEIKAYAKAKGISIREAQSSDYVGFLRDKEQSKRREIEASASTKSTGKTAKKDFSSLAGEDIRNLDDESFEAYKGWLKSQG